MFNQFIGLVLNYNNTIINSIVNMPFFNTILGFILGLFSKFVYDILSRKNKSKNIKNIIKKEVLFNKKLLLNFKKTINDESIVQWDCPPFLFDNWDKLRNDIVDNFNHSEMDMLFDFYLNLKSLVESDLWIKPFKIEPNYKNGVLTINEPFTQDNLDAIIESKSRINCIIDNSLDIVDSLNYE